MFTKKTVKDIDVSGKRVLLRAPLNVPIVDGRVGDEFRLKSLLPTLDYLLENNASVILISHHSTEDTSLEPIAPVLTKLLGRNVEFVHACVGGMVEQRVASLEPGQVILLENLRFHTEEEDGDEDFAQDLAQLADIFVNDDFTVMHRAHASVVGIPKFLPAVAGFQVEHEVQELQKAIDKPKKPILLIVGGAKISTKIDLLNNFLSKADGILIGGAMANTFLKAQGQNIGQSMYSKFEVHLAKKIIEDAKRRQVELFLPVDVVLTTDIEKLANIRTASASDVGNDEIIADLGPKSVGQVDDMLKGKGTVIWNGPLGITEKKPFQAASLKLANDIIKSGAISIVGGGDSAAFLNDAGLSGKFGFVSTGGGAALELLSGKVLPGFEALENR